MPHRRKGSGGYVVFKGPAFQLNQTINPYSEPKKLKTKKPLKKFKKRRAFRKRTAAGLVGQVAPGTFVQCFEGVSGF
jgi:hypothetical protein